MFFRRVVNKRGSGRGIVHVLNKSTRLAFNMSSLGIQRSMRIDGYDALL